MGLGSGKKFIQDPGPGVKKAPNPGSGSATLLKSRRSFWKVDEREFDLDLQSI
jgi:hypothetical protein